MEFMDQKRKKQLRYFKVYLTYHKQVEWIMQLGIKYLMYM